MVRRLNSNSILALRQETGGEREGEKEREIQRGTERERERVHT